MHVLDATSAPTPPAYVADFPSPFPLPRDPFNLHSQVEALLSTFPASHPSITLLRKILTEFRDDELEHLDTAVENESQQAPHHALLSALIAAGCRGAIGVSGKI